MMKKYDRVMSTFLHKVNKLERIADKNDIKIGKLIHKSERIKAQIEARINKLECKNLDLASEAHACKRTAKKINDLLI